MRYLTTRNGIYYYRRAVPLSLRKLLKNKSEVTISLKGSVATTTHLSAENYNEIRKHHSDTEIANVFNIIANNADLLPNTSPAPTTIPTTDNAVVPMVMTNGTTYTIKKLVDAFNVMPNRKAPKKSTNVGVNSG